MDIKDTNDGRENKDIIFDTKDIRNDKDKWVTKDIRDTKHKGIAEDKRDIEELR